MSYYCPYCPKTYVLNHHYRGHLANCHEGEIRLKRDREQARRDAEKQQPNVYNHKQEVHYHVTQINQFNIVLSDAKKTKIQDLLKYYSTSTEPSQCAQQLLEAAYNNKDIDPLANQIATALDEDIPDEKCSKEEKQIHNYICDILGL